MNNTTSQQLWFVLKLPNGFIPFIAKPKRIFLHFWPNLGNSWSIFFHCIESARWRSSSSHLLISHKTTDNRVNLVEPTYIRVSTPANIISYTCACAKAFEPTSRIMSSILSSSTRYSRRSSMVESTTCSVRATVGKSINSLVMYILYNF